MFECGCSYLKQPSAFLTKLLVKLLLAEPSRDCNRTCYTYGQFMVYGAKKTKLTLQLLKSFVLHLFE
jgi:hypothetical protein